MNEPQELPDDDTTDNEAEGLPPKPDLSAEVAALKDQLLRALADAENARRRALKERDDTAKYAVSNFAKEMLAVADNFSRAMESAPKAVDDPALRNVLVGLEATDRQLKAALERFGIKKMEPVGKVFDPHFHQAMSEIDDPHHPAGTVIQVLQDGYLIQDRLLREALVSVTKGGAPAAKVDTSA